MNGMTKKEFLLIEKIFNKIYLMNKKLGLATLLQGSILRHFYQKRLLDTLLPNHNSVLEIGPGSGYLSLLLAMDNKNVYCTDVTQVFYIYQHYLFKEFNLLEEFSSLEDSNVLKNKSKKLDTIIINHAICELDRLAVHHLLKVAKNLNVINFFMETAGHEEHSYSFVEICKVFKSQGYILTYSTNDVYIFTFQETKKYNKFIFYDDLIRIFLLVKKLFMK